MAISSALVCVSYGPDIERVRLQLDSLAALNQRTPPYYLVVPRRDIQAFGELGDASPLDVRVICEDDLLPWWVVQLPWSNRWRLSLAGVPLRGWVVQQLCKLNLDKCVQEELLIILDSDVFFLKPLALEQYIDGDRVRLLAVPGRGQSKDHYDWHRTAARLLGLRPRDHFGFGYIGNVVTWRRSTLQALHRHLDRRHLAGWAVAVANNRTISEYILYGIFADNVAKDRGLHFQDHENDVLEYWTQQPLDAAALQAFFDGVEDKHRAVMITSKAGIQPSQYRAHAERLWSASRHSTPAAHQGEGQAERY